MQEEEMEELGWNDRTQWRTKVKIKIQAQEDVVKHCYPEL